MAIKADKEEDFVKVDLHIHTPASLDYKGQSNDDEYYSILQNAQSKKIRIIAITDHNTIEGYNKLISLKNKLTLEQESLSAITDSQQIARKLLDIKKKLSLFEGILILPGIEFTARPGVHILIIFNPSVSLQSIQQFLSDGGYNPEDLGNKEPPTLSNWDAVTLLDKTKAYDCIVLDDNTDSEKGFWTELKGLTRIHCLCSEQLSGICYKNEVQRDHIYSLLSSPQYKRAIPPAFLKVSDAHMPSEVGKIFTWAKLEDLSFESLTKSFLNPLESFSTEKPTTARLLNKLTELSNSFGIPKLESDDDISHFLKLSCALNNSEGGYILLGCTKNKNRIGILPSGDSTTADGIASTIDTAFSNLVNKLERFFSLNIPQVRTYILQNRRFILSLYFTKGSSLVNIKDDPSVYSIRGNRIVSLTAVQIESLIEEKVLKDIETRIVNRLQAVENDCLQIRHLTTSLPLLRRFEMNSAKIMAAPVITKPVTLNDNQSQKLLDSHYTHGCARGNLFYVENSISVRLPYAYLRHNLPIWFVQNPIPKPLLKETIYIAPGGAVYYSRYDYPFYSNKYPVILKIHRDRMISVYGIRFAVSFLKSSFHLWYLHNRYHNIDLINYDLFSNLRLPIINVNRPSSKEQISLINNTFDAIIKQERRFISEFNKAYIHKKVAVKNEFISNHNIQIEKSFYTIDQAIYKLLDISDKEIDAIESNLRFNNIYLPMNTPPINTEESPLTP